MFQFRKVQLILFYLSSSATSLVFQFRKVQLILRNRKQNVPQSSVSIPQGPINTVSARVAASAASFVSIPQGPINTRLS